MKTSRLEAFSDGVLAIIITIMVLELRTPEGVSWTDLAHAAGSGIFTYLLSFIYIGIYWNNHHHLFQLVKRTTGGVLWTNLGLLFCLSLLPFSTSWMDESGFAQVPVIVYGANILAAAVAYYILERVIIADQGEDSPLRLALGRGRKELISPGLYLTGIVSAVVFGRVGIGIALACFITVAVMWVVPDRRIENAVREHGGLD